MASTLDAEQLGMASSIKAGAAGTSSWKRGEIVWAANSGIVIVCAGLGIWGVMYFEFVLVPLSIAYFLEFLVAPLMNFLEFRPIDCKVCPHANPASCPSHWGCASKRRRLCMMVCPVSLC